MSVLSENSSRHLAGKGLPAGRNAGRAFTLTELLIVLAIVGFLASLLFPSFSKMGEKSRDAKCMSNLRILASASLSYFQDNDGRLFPNKFWYDTGSGIRDYVISSTSKNANAPEFQRDTVFTCPELKRLHPVKYPTYLNRNYTINFLAFENNPTTGEPTNERPKRLANIPSLPRMWLFTDGSYASATVAGYYDILLRRIDLAPGSKVVVELASPHSGRQNTIFFDGHAEPLSPDDFYHPKSIRQFWGEVTAQD